MGILVKEICKKFGDFVAVDRVSFEVKEGELVALLGPSGRGKSTMLRIIAGLETPDNGEIYLTGKDVTTLSPQKRKVGFVFQHYALFKHMTAEKKPGQTEEQFLYKTRKKALGPFKKDILKLSGDIKEKITHEVSDKFAFLFDKLKVAGTKDLVLKYSPAKPFVPENILSSKESIEVSGEGDD